MNSRKKIAVYLFILCCIFFLCCTKDKGKRDYTSNGFPQQVASIIANKCATSGCHNDISKQAAGGLSLVTWEKMFQGSRAGSVVIPYRTDFSTLIYYTNSYDEFGKLQLSPKMPVGSNPLSFEEVKTLYDWINQGAPNANGLTMFGANVNSTKFYVANQGCDEVTVFDAASMLAMRYIKVGKSGNIEAPHMVRVSPDNKFWCVSFLGSQYFQKFSTSDNTLQGEANIGFGSWNTFAISSDAQKAYVVDWSANGKIAVVNLTNMTNTVIPGFINPHGSALNKTNNTLYVTSQTGNFIYKIPVNDFSNYSQITLDGSMSPNTFSSLDPHEIVFSPDGTKYFVSCQKSNDIRVLSAANDSLLEIIPVGVFPQEMAITNNSPYLFITCTEDNITFPGKTSSVYILNYNTFTVVKSLYLGHQSHGIAIDEINKKVFISNRNVTTGGPAPHHSSLCSGRNGYITCINLQSLSVQEGYKAEVSVDPYGLGISN